MTKIDSSSGICLRRGLFCQLPNWNFAFNIHILPVKICLTCKFPSRCIIRHFLVVYEPMLQIWCLQKQISCYASEVYFDIHAFISVPKRCLQYVYFHNKLEIWEKGNKWILCLIFTQIFLQKPIFLSSLHIRTSFQCQHKDVVVFQTCVVLLIKILTMLFRCFV